MGLGKVVITAKTSNGKTATTTVTSDVKSMSLEISNSSIYYYGVKTSKATLKVDSNGYNLSNDEIEWSIPDASGQSAPASSSTSGKVATITARKDGSHGNVNIKVTVGNKTVTKVVYVEPALSIYTNTDNTTSFSNKGTYYYCTFKGEKVLSVSTNVDVSWVFDTDSSVIGHSETVGKRKLVLYVQYVAQNGLYIKAKTAGGQVKEITVTPQS